MRSRWRAWRLRVAREQLKDLERDAPAPWHGGVHPRVRRYYDQRLTKLRAKVARLAGEDGNR